MANEAYKLKADASFPRAIRKAVNVDGVELVETEGRTYDSGSYVLADDLTERDRERAENGELDHLLEPVSKEEAEAGLSSSEFGVFIPEHEAERHVFQEYGHQTVPRDQVLELRAAGAEEAREVLEAAKEDGADERPALREPNRPSLVEVSNDTEGGVNNVPEESEHVSEEAVEGLEQPPGIPVGADKASAEGAEAKPKRSVGRPKAVEKQEKVVEQAKEKQQQAQEKK